MIVWLASYPRSGNTFVRLLMKQGLGLATYSTHKGDDFTERRLADLIGHETEGDTKDLIDKARRSADLFVIKTHYVPQTDDPRIYIVRDGRAATVSYLHFCLDSGLLVSLEQLIEGVPFIGSWTGHIASWDPSNNQNTLLLKYEDIVHAPGIALKCISEFLKTPVIGEVKTSFDELHSIQPLIFRAGDNKKNIEELGSHVGHFFARHGAAMVGMGYSTIGEVYDKSLEYFSALQARSIIATKLDNISVWLNAHELNSQTRYETLYTLALSHSLSKSSLDVTVHTPPSSITII